MFVHNNETVINTGQRLDAGIAQGRLAIGQPTDKPAVLKVRVPGELARGMAMEERSHLRQRAKDDGGLYAIGGRQESTGKRQLIAVAIVLVNVANATQVEIRILVGFRRRNEKTILMPVGEVSVRRRTHPQPFHTIGKTAL